MTSCAFTSPRVNRVAAPPITAATPQARGTDAASAAVPQFPSAPHGNGDRRTLKVLDPIHPVCRVCKRFPAWESGMCVRCVEEWTDLRDGEDKEFDE